MGALPSIRDHGNPARRGVDLRYDDVAGLRDQDDGRLYPWMGKGWFIKRAA